MNVQAGKQSTTEKEKLSTQGSSTRVPEKIAVNKDKRQLIWYINIPDLIWYLNGNFKEMMPE